MLPRLLCVKCFQSVNHSQSNAQKSKCMMVSVHKWRSLRSIKISDVCQFYLDGKPLEFVESYSHLGHIITNTLKDSSNIVFRRGCLIGQINSVLCYFGKLDSFVKVRLLKCFCIAYMAVNYGTWTVVALMDSVLLGGRA